MRTRLPTTASHPPSRHRSVARCRVCRSRKSSARSASRPIISCCCAPNCTIVFSAGGARRRSGGSPRFGHEIGLHLDASLYGNATAMLGKARRLRNVRCSRPRPARAVHVISFHRPAKELLGCPGHARRPHSCTINRGSSREMGYCSRFSRRLAPRSSARSCRRPRGPRVAAAHPSDLVDTATSSKASSASSTASWARVLRFCAMSWRVIANRIAMFWRHSVDATSIKGPSHDPCRPRARHP